MQDRSASRITDPLSKCQDGDQQAVNQLVPNVHQLSSSEFSNAGKRLGPYQIVAEIGRGAMGEVYRALRVDDQYKKEVAIKLIRSGRESQSVIARFRNERQILANLEHPNIARLLDGGTSTEGVPYLVMELIEGESILHYCDRNSLDLAARLGLFLQVCSAVQFAHQRLVIHRDIKPGNILVTMDGTPKLLDFGISTILGDEDETRPSGPSVTFMLTPAYASPEQVKHEIITTVSDVYSLGVVLYELLTGRHPYPIDRTPDQVLRAVCEEEPEKPSTAVKKRRDLANSGLSNPSLAGSVGTEGKLSKRLRGDLDNIVLLALRKEPSRRYKSVEQFADDIRRYLGNLPVIARKDTARYRAAKFVLRHKAGMAATAIALSALVGVFVVAAREARIAQRRFNDVHALANSLIFDVHDAITDVPGSTPARKLIAERAVQYLSRLAPESGGDIGLQRELATGYERLGLVQGHTLQDNLGDTKGSLESYKAALELRKEIAVRSTDWNDRLMLAHSYRLVADMQGVIRTNESRSNIDQAIAISEVLDRQHPNDFSILHELASEYYTSSRLGYAGFPNEQSTWAEISSKTLATYEKALKIQPDDPETRHEYALSLRSRGEALEDTNPKSALEYYQRVLEIEGDLTRKSNATKYVKVLALSYRDLAAVYGNLGDTTRKIDSERKSLEILQGMHRADPKNSSIGRSLAIEYANMALALSAIGKGQLAQEHWQESLRMIRGLVMPDPQNPLNRHYLAGIVAMGGTLFIREGKPEPAIKQFSEARTIYLALLDAGGASSFEIASAAQCSVKMAEAEMLAGNAAGAARDFNRALALADPLIAHKPPNLNALYAAADAYSGLGDLTMKRLKKDGTLTSKDHQDREEACSSYSKSMDMWRQIEHPNRSAPGNSLDAGDPAQVQKKLTQCEAAQ